MPVHSPMHINEKIEILLNDSSLLESMKISGRKRAIENSMKKSCFKTNRFFLIAYK